MHVVIRSWVSVASILFAAMVESVVPASAVPAAAVYLTAPAAGQFDQFAETIAVPGGFLVAWTRLDSAGSAAVLAQEFTPAGRPLKALVTIRAKAPLVGGRPEMVALAGGKIAIFWLDQNDLWARLYDPTTNTAAAPKKLIKFGDLIHDVVRLSSGNIALVSVVTDVSKPADVREKVSLTILSPALAIVKGPISVHGRGFAQNFINEFDHTVVDKTNGAVVLFRDRVGGQLFAQQLTNAGALVGAAVKVNTTPLRKGFVTDQMGFNVKAVRLTSGNIVVTWVSLERDGADGTEVRARILNAAGVPIGKDFLVHAAKAGKQFSPDLVALPAGRFAVLWATQVNGFNNSLWVRPFANTGVPAKAERQTEADTMFVLGTETEALRLPDGSIANVIEGFIGAGSAPRVRADGIPASQL